MVEATYVLFVSKRLRGRVRTGLAAEPQIDIRCRERKTLRGSEFYFSGPAALARQAHASASGWIKELPYA
jgi:hypothetical protein